MADLSSGSAAHYHGDVLRVLFVSAAALMFVAELLNASLPFSTMAGVLIIIVLVIAAGLTNPAQAWILFVDLLISVTGLLVFGATALTRFRTHAPLTQSLLIAALAIIFLFALYFATRTVRGRLVP